MTISEFAHMVNSGHKLGENICVLLDRVQSDLQNISWIEDAETRRKAVNNYILGPMQDIRDQAKIMGDSYLKHLIDIGKEAQK